MRVDYDVTNSMDSEGNGYHGSSNPERKSESNLEKSYAVDSTEEYAINRVDHKKPDLSAELAALLSTFSDNVKTNPAKRSDIIQLLMLYVSSACVMLYSFLFVEISSKYHI